MVFLIQMLVKQKGKFLCFNNFIMFILDINGIVGYQTLLQYFLRNLDERSNDTFLDEVDEVNYEFFF